jgi:hypothetical protein
MEYEFITFLIMFILNKNAQTFIVRSRKDDYHELGKKVKRTIYIYQSYLPTDHIVKFDREINITGKVLALTITLTHLHHLGLSLGRFNTVVTLCVWSLAAFTGDTARIFWYCGLHLLVVSKEVEKIMVKLDLREAVVIVTPVWITWCVHVIVVSLQLLFIPIKGGHARTHFRSMFVASEHCQDGCIAPWKRSCALGDCHWCTMLHMIELHTHRIKVH